QRRRRDPGRELEPLVRPPDERRRLGASREPLGHGLRRQDVGEPSVPGDRGLGLPAPGRRRYLGGERRRAERLLRGHGRGGPRGPTRRDWVVLASGSNPVTTGVVVLEAVGSAVVPDGRERRSSHTGRSPRSAGSTRSRRSVRSIGGGAAGTSQATGMADDT